MWSVVQVYPPTEQSRTTEIYTFYSLLQDAINKYCHKIFVVMGNFNARTGEGGKGEQMILGPYCSGKKIKKWGEARAAGIRKQFKNT